MEKWEREYFKKTLNTQATLTRKKITPKNADEFKDATIISTFIYSRITERVLEHLPNLQLIATRSTGFDHIDIEACKKRGIHVANVPTYGENTVAEHTFALILSLSRKIYQAYRQVKELNFDFHGLRGFDLKGKTIGIVGCGHIGQHVARIARGFDMRVLVYDLHRDPRLAKKLGFTYAASLRSLLSRSDIITLHAPYNKHTHHLLNRDTMAHIKKGALLINTARGGLVDTDALIWALDKKILAGAGLDVLEEEYAIKEERELLSRHLAKKHNLKTILENHILIVRDNVLVTPHIAFNSEEAVKRILDTTVENINAFRAGKKKNWVV